MKGWAEVADKHPSWDVLLVGPEGDVSHLRQIDTPAMRRRLTVSTKAQFAPGNLHFPSGNRGGPWMISPSAPGSQAFNASCENHMVHRDYGSCNSL